MLPRFSTRGVVPAVGRRYSQLKRLWSEWSEADALQSFTALEMADEETPNSAAISSCCQLPFMYRMTAAILSCCESFVCLATLAAGGMMKTVVEAGCYDLQLPPDRISFTRQAACITDIKSNGVDIEYLI